MDETVEILTTEGQHVRVSVYATLGKIAAHLLEADRAYSVSVPYAEGKWAKLASTDTLAADGAADRRRIQDLERERDRYRDELKRMLDNAVRDDRVQAPEDGAVLSLCELFGFGAVMSSAARQWAKRDEGGAFFIGGCRAVLRHVLGGGDG